MLNTRSRLVALVVALVFCVQIFTPALVLAQSAPPTPTPPSFDPPSVPNVNMSVQSTGEAHAEFPPTGITPNPMPDQGTISAEMVTVLSNAVTSAGHVIIDFGSLPGGVLDHGANNFMNTGTIYAISTNPEITTATIAAQNIFNATGATITTVLPEGGLSGYSNVVASLSLTLAAVESVVNAGTIASAGNLNITAGTSIINALPSVLPSNIMATAPVMQAANNLNLLSPNITNAGMMASIASNINIATQTAQNIIINNVGGTLQAFDSINIRDHNFAGKFDTFLLGGDVLAERLNVYSGDGLAKLQLDVMTPALTLLAGDGYVSTTSDLRIAKVVYTGDPIHISGGDVVFESDVDPITGEKTGIVTGGGTFSGANARIASDVDTINISGAIITLSGSADLSSLPISVLSSLKIEAAGSINTSSIGAGSAIILVSSGGSVTTGTLSAGDFIQLQAPSGEVTAGSLTSNAGGVIVHGQDIHVGEIRAVNQPGFVDIKAQTPTPFIIGTSPDPEAPQPNILSITMNGGSPTGEAWVNIDNPGGVTISSPGAVTISTPGTFSGLSINAQNGTVTLPEGTMTFRGGNFAVSADTILANGTTIDVSSAAGPGGVIFLGATNIDRGSDGLTLNANGGDNLGSGIGIGGKESVLIFTQFSGVFNQRNISYSGTVDAPFAITGSGPLIATSNGTVNGGNIFIDSLSTATLSGGPMTFSANGAGSGNGGFVQLFNNYIVNNVSHPDGIRLSANGAGMGNGGFVQARADRFDANLTVNADRTLSPQILTLSAASGTVGGNGGTVDIKAGRMLSVDPDAITTGTIGSGSGNGQRLTIVGGTRGSNGGGITFLQGGTLSNDGKGTGHGGLVQIGAFGDDSDVRLLAQVGDQTELVNVTATGGANGDGGMIQSDAGRSINLASANLDASAGAQGNGIGGTVILTARLPQDGGIGTYSQSGSIIANGAGAGDGGFVWVRGPNMSIGSGASFAANGGFTGSGGTVVVQSGSDLNLPANVSASAGSAGNGSGGLVQIDSGFASVGDLTISGAVSANGAGEGSGGFITSHAFSGDYSVSSDGSLVADGDGGAVLVQAGGNVSNAGLISASASTGTGNAGAIELDAGLNGVGSHSISGIVRADAPGTGLGGAVFVNNFGFDPLSVSLTGTLSTTSAAGQQGTVNFNHNGAVQVSGSGTISGDIKAIGTSVDVLLPNAADDLTIATITATSGNVSLRAPSIIESQNTQSTIDATGDVTMLASLIDPIDINTPAGRVFIADPGTNTDFIELGDINATLIDIRASGSGNIIQGAGALWTASTMNLSSGTGTIGTLVGDVVTPIRITTSSVKANTSGDGNVFLSSQQAVTVQSSTAGDRFELSSTGDVTVSESVSARQVITRTTNGANILLSDEISASDRVALNADGNIIQSSVTGAISAPDIDLVATTGSIGSASNAVVTRATDELSATADGGNVFVSQTGDLRLQESRAAQAFQLTVTGGVTVEGDLTARNITINALFSGTGVGGGIGTVADITATETLTLSGSLIVTTTQIVDGVEKGTLRARDINMSTIAGSNGAIVLGSDLRGDGLISLNANGSGNISQSGGHHIFGAGGESSGQGRIALSSGTGNIGVPTAVIQTSGNILAVRTGGQGQVNILQDRDIKLDTSSAGSTLTIVVQGNTSIHNPAPSDAEIEARAISAGTVNLIGLSRSVPSPDGDGQVSAGGEINVGGINIRGTSQVNLLADKAITQTVGETNNSEGTRVGAVIAPAVRFVSSLGDIGSESHPLAVQTNNMGFVAGNELFSGDIFVSHQSLGSSVSLRAEGDTINVEARSTMLVTFVQGGDIILRTAPGTLGGIRISNDITGDIVALIADGEILRSGGVITGEAVTLQANGGSIGTVTGNVITNAENLAAFANETSSIFLTNNREVRLLDSFAGATLQLTNVGDMKVDGTITADSVLLQTTSGGIITLDPPVIATTNATLIGDGGLNIESGVSASAGSVSLIANSGALVVAPNMTLTATEGNLLLQNLDTTAGTISIGSGAVLTASSTQSSTLGQVHIVIGAVPGSPAAGDVPAFVSVNATNGGQVFFGSIGITALPPSNAINADGSIVVFETAGLPASAITLGGGVTINASASAGSFPPGHGGLPPGQGGNQPPGLGGATTPGFGATPPGLGGTPPGQDRPADTQPPGQIGKEKKASANSQSEYVPVAFIHYSAPRFEYWLESYHTRTAELRHAGSSRVFQSSAGRLRLEQGELLVNSFEETSVQLKEASVRIASKSTVLLLQTDSGCVIQNLGDCVRQAVIVTFNGQQIPLSTGEEIQIGQTPSSAPKRRMERLGSEAVRAEVSSLWLLQNSPTLKGVRLSEQKSDKALANRILKSAACLMHVTSKYGPYSMTR